MEAPKPLAMVALLLIAAAAAATTAEGAATAPAARTALVGRRKASLAPATLAENPTPGESYAKARPRVLGLPPAGADAGTDGVSSSSIGPLSSSSSSSSGTAAPYARDGTDGGSGGSGGGGGGGSPYSSASSSETGPFAVNITGGGTDGGGVGGSGSPYSSSASGPSPVGAPAPSSSPLPSPAPPSAVPATSVCGANDLRTSSRSNVCQIVANWRLVDPNADDDGDGREAWSCSAFRVGPTALATAGHCVYWLNPRYTTAYPESIDIYCASNVCNGRGGKPVARGLRALASPRWEASGGEIPMPWDWAVVETSKTLPGSSLRLGAAATGGGTRRARLSGYPDSSFANADAGKACASKAYDGGCRQYSSSGTVQTLLVDPRAPGFLSSSALDLCPGQSGGPVVDASTGDAIAVVSGFYGNQCLNLFAPQAAEADVDASTCERAAGGSSVKCLWRKLTGGTKRDVVG